MITIIAVLLAWPWWRCSWPPPSSRRSCAELPAGTSRTRSWSARPPRLRNPPVWLHCGGMPDSSFDAAERARLADLLDELGPDALTLLPPWTTRDIAAHLVLRERDPLAGPGLVLPGTWSR